MRLCRRLRIWERTAFMQSLQTALDRCSASQAVLYLRFPAVRYRMIGGTDRNKPRRDSTERIRSLDFDLRIFSCICFIPYIYLCKYPKYNINWIRSFTIIDSILMHKYNWEGVLRVLFRVCMLCIMGICYVVSCYVGCSWKAFSSVICGLIEFPGGCYEVDRDHFSLLLYRVL